ncbi:carbon-nitrogen hydrolase family protein [Candidatus Woesearchaeota archaeon]|nr:carbon-nitrogen hydrolase family protein [Candidatus Woesearchaeota archaeon]
MRFKIAVVQFDIKQFSPMENLRRAENFVKKAARSKAHLVVFPEDFITGPIAGKTEFADSAKKYRDKFRQLAKKYKIDVVPGSFIEKDRKGLYNTTYYVDSRGTVKGQYRKINLWHPERTYLSPGYEVPVFKTRYGKIGLMICWDLMFPELFRKMVTQGVDLIICPSYWCYGDAGKGVKYDPNSEIKLVDSLCVARAFENEIIFVYCNAAGKLQLENFEDTLIGHSQITVPFQGALKKLAHNRQEMFMQEVDTALLKDAEKAYKIRQSLKK